MNKRVRNGNFSLSFFSPKNRRGSHIDVIISFVIFISFILFTYALLQPTLTTKQSKESIASSLEIALVNNLSNGSSNNLTIVSLSANQGSTKGCINLNNFFSNVKVNNTLVVKNATGAIFGAYNSSSNNDLFIDTSSNRQLSYFFYVYYSPSFSPIPSNGPLSGCNNLQYNSNNNNYLVGQTQMVSSSSQNIFDFNVVNLINTYNQNYDYVKTWFSLSPSNNFGFNFTYQNQTTIGTNDKIPQFAEVYSQAFPVLYVSGNNSLQSGLLTVRVW